MIEIRYLQDQHGRKTLQYRTLKQSIVNNEDGSACILDEWDSWRNVETVVAYVETWHLEDAQKALK